MWQQLVLSSLFLIRSGAAGNASIPPIFLISIIAALAIYLLVLSRINHQPIILLLCLFFPGNYENFIFGQNGFISGILLGGGLLLLDRYPIIAGCLFGLLGYKPPLVILTFIALGFGRYWKTLISAFATIIILVLSSLAVFGFEVWLAYFKAMSVPMTQMVGDQFRLVLVPTFFAAIRNAGFGARVAYPVQGVVMALVLAGVGWVWQKKLAITIRGPVLVLGTLIFTPYSFVYDLAILALPLLWLWEEGRLHGRLPGELILLLLGWLLPFEARFFYIVQFLSRKIANRPVNSAGAVLSRPGQGKDCPRPESRLISAFNSPRVFLRYTRLRHLPTRGRPAPPAWPGRPACRSAWNGPCYCSEIAHTGRCNKDWRIGPAIL